MTRSADSKSWSMLSKMRAMKFCGWSVLDCRLYCADQGRQPSVSGGWYIERLAFTRSACPQVPAPSANPLTKKQRVPRQSAWHPRAWCRNGQGDIASGGIIDAQEYRHFSDSDSAPCALSAWISKGRDILQHVQRGDGGRGSQGCGGLITWLLPRQV